MLCNAEAEKSSPLSVQFGPVCSWKEPKAEGTEIQTMRGTMRPVRRTHFRAAEQAGSGRAHVWQAW